jgi:hypothetical protein
MDLATKGDMDPSSTNKKINLISQLKYFTPLIFSFPKGARSPDWIVEACH